MIEDRKIYQWVDGHAAEIVELLQALVRIPSITGNETAIGQ